MSNTFDLWPLPPLAQGMVFETLKAGRGRPYFEQITMELEGIDPIAFRRAVEETVAAAPNLMASIEHEDLDAPVAVIREHVTLPWAEEDWTGRGPGRLEAYLAADRARGFELTEPPLMRALLAREGDGRWRFVLSYHHLLMDGWSGALLFDELDERYTALREARPPRIEPRPPYSEFLAWLGARDLTSAEAYWRRRLAHTPVTGVPLGKAGARPGRIVEARAQVAAEVWARAGAMARQLAVTPAVLAAAGWALILSRAHGETEVLFGQTIAGRPADLPGADRMIGLFINTVPIRASVPEDLTLQAFLRTLQQTMTEAREHGHAPLPSILGWAAPERATLDTLFVYENYPASASGARGRLGVQMEQSREESSFLAAVILEPQTDGALAISLCYDDARLDAQAAALLVERYVQLLTAMSQAQADTPLGLIDHRGRADIAVAAGLRAKAPALRCPPLLPDLFLAQAAAAPDRPAIICQDRMITYGELETQARRLAGAILERAGRSRPVVAVGMEQNADYYVALVAILLSGGASFSIDQTSPAARLVEAAALVGPDLFLTDGSCAAPPELGPPLHIDAPSPQSVALPVVAPDDVAYVILTSGSTGTPKPVAVQHRPLAFLAALEPRGASASRRHAAILRPQFDAAFIAVLESLFRGETLVTPAPDEDPELTLTRGAATDVAMTPSLLSLLPPDGLPALRKVRIGGETPSGALVEAWGDRVELVNSFGPTETTIFVTEERLRPGEPITIGRPLPHVSAYVLSPALRPVGIGEVGELYLAGPALALGYLGLPGRTARVFLPDPFGPGGGRMYRTGDLARVQADGRIVFIGRRDGQVKLRGQRIELGEVEAALYAAGLATDEAAAVIAPGASGRPQLVACVTRPIDADRLEAAYAARLPPGFRPQATVQIDALPLTPNGKLDRKALVARVTRDREGFESGAAAFRDDRERAVAQAIATALGLDVIGPDDDFFALGGDSIVSLQAATLARKAGLEVTAGMVVAHRTARAIAEAASRPTTAGGLIKLAEGPGRPVVLIGGAGGGSEAMAALARSLTGHAVLAYEPDPRLAGVEALAQALVDEIARVGVGKAPVLIGHSFGAYVAVESVRLLRSRGGAPLLVVLDAAAPIPERPRPAPGDDQAVLQALAEMVEEVTGRAAPAGGVDRAMLLILLIQAGLARDEAEAEALINQSRGHGRANAAYVAQPLEIPSMLLVRARERGNPLRGFEPPDMPQEDWGWSKLVAGHVATAQAAGNHISMLRGDLGAELGAMIRVYLHYECAADDEEMTADA